MYILTCADGTTYVGSCRDLAHRLWQHSTGNGSKYTSGRLPVELAYAEQFDRIDDAYLREKQVQGWSRAKRRALIESRFADLPALSESRGARPADFDRLNQPDAG